MKRGKARLSIIDRTTWRSILTENESKTKIKIWVDTEERLKNILVFLFLFFCTSRSWNNVNIIILVCQLLGSSHVLIFHTLTHGLLHLCNLGWCFIFYRADILVVFFVSVICLPVWGVCVICFRYWHFISILGSRFQGKLSYTWEVLVISCIIIKFRWWRKRK